MWILSATLRQCSMNACSSAELFWRTNDRISFGRRLPSSARMRTSRSMLAMTLSYFRPIRVDSKTSLPDGVDADVDGVEPRFDHAAGDFLVDQRSVADHADFLDPLLLGVADLLDQLAVDERLAVVVHPDVRDAELDALVHDLLEQVEAHDPLLAVHLVARAEHALRVADVGALDLHDLGQDRRAVAAGREQQTPHRLRLLAEHVFGDVPQTAVLSRI